jgi:hypothetical protein
MEFEVEYEEGGVRGFGAGEKEGRGLLNPKATDFRS